jgi:N-acetylmuramoyl-L-alanine amidase
VARLPSPPDLGAPPDENVSFLKPSFQRFSRSGRVLPLLFLLGLALLFWPTRLLRSDNFVFYFPKSRSLVPLEMLGKHRYLPIMQVLNLVGKVGALQERRNSVRIWFGETQIELRLDERVVRLNKARFKLEQPVRMANGQWVVPVDFLTTVLPQLIRETVEYQTNTNRVFIGDVRPGSFTVRLDPIPEGARLTVQFTDKVTMRTAASNGKWYLFLGDQAMEPLEPSYQFSGPYVKELQFDDQDGLPKLIITPAESGLDFYPTLAEGGKVLVADVRKPAAPAEAGEAAPSAPAPSQPAPGAPAPAAAGQPGVALPVVVLDPGHGGDNAGGHSRDGVWEKDLVAQVVARVRLALIATQKYQVILTRVGDASVSFEQRAVTANVAHARLFLSFHAGNMGTTTPRVIVYTYRPSSPRPAAVGDTPRPLLVPWNQVQERHLFQSRRLAEAVRQQLTRLAAVTVDEPADAPVRTLRSIDAPAVAIEIGSLNGDVDAAPLTNADFQQRLANAVVQAIAAFEGGAG